MRVDEITLYDSSTLLALEPKECITRRSEPRRDDSSAAPNKTTSNFGTVSTNLTSSSLLPSFNICASIHGCCGPVILFGVEGQTNECGVNFSSATSGVPWSCIVGYIKTPLIWGSGNDPSGYPTLLMYSYPRHFCVVRTFLLWEKSCCGIFVEDRFSHMGANRLVLLLEAKGSPFTFVLNT